MNKKINLVRIQIFIVIGIFISSCKSEADREAESIQLGDAFKSVFGQYAYQGDNENVTGKVTKWNYKDGVYELTVATSCLASVSIFLVYDRTCQAERTYILKFDSDKKLISIQKGAGNQCALELEVATTAGNVLANVNELQSKMEEYLRKQRDHK